MAGSRANAPSGTRPEILTRTELGRSGDWTLLKQQLVGVSGQVCSTTYELAGPRPGHYSALADARAAFERASSRVFEDAA